MAIGRRRLTPVATAGPPARGLVQLPSSYGVLGAALADPAVVVEAGSSRPPLGDQPVGHELASAIPGEDGAWGVLLLVRRRARPRSPSAS